MCSIPNFAVRTNSFVAILGGSAGAKIESNIASLTLGKFIDMLLACAVLDDPVT